MSERIFFPLAVTACPETVFADLRPVKQGQCPPLEEDLACFVT